MAGPRKTLSPTRYAEADENTANNSRNLHQERSLRHAESTASDNRFTSSRVE